MKNGGIGSYVLCGDFASQTVHSHGVLMPKAGTCISNASAGGVLMLISRHLYM